MKRQLYILSIALAASAVGNQAFASIDKSQRPVRDIKELLMEAPVSYNKDVVESPNWSGNWFIGIKAGANSFIGSPTGCGDLGNRIKPHFGAYVGKWYTPTVGSRLSFEGFKIHAADKQSQDYWGSSADFLWNLSNALYGNGNTPRLGLIPFVGVGMLHNSDARTSPFALSYGIMAQYGITSRLNVTVEFGGKTTFSDFDGIGEQNSFGGDNILSLSAGLSFTFGKNGFRKVIDAKPVMVDNARLREALASFYDENSRLSRKSAEDARALAELKKILKIEGLLSKYGNLFNSSSDDSELSRRYPVNDYSGLNKLRARLNGYNSPSDKSSVSGDEMASAPEFSDDELSDLIDGILNGDDSFDSMTDNNDGSDGTDGNRQNEEYWSLVKSGKKCVGSPIYFFFNMGTSTLTDRSQLVNLDEIARIAKAYGLRVRVTGAADSATGTSDINKGFGNDRASYIVKELQNRGVPNSLMTKINKGGINILNPNEANRHCKIELFLLPDK